MKLFTRARDVAGVDECSVEAANVNELMKGLSDRFGRGLGRVLRGSEIFVNGVNVSAMKGYETELVEKDVIWLIPAVGGG